ncbi:hypothetical protein F2P81_017471 [Scophthalmus maximus]|uniref:Uncharacterized protein n=1 Tax=Scophthalmus maximus TaxID=52904 RepID=A0A6A4SFU3_SCOMX|nr:hypothetical protein F2P81_017471 [Scophthalmus maximus]
MAARAQTRHKAGDMHGGVGHEGSVHRDLGQLRQNTGAQRSPPNTENATAATGHTVTETRCLLPWIVAHEIDDVGYLSVHREKNYITHNVQIMQSVIRSVEMQ